VQARREIAKNQREFIVISRKSLPLNKVYNSKYDCMKKLGIILVVAAALAALVSACKTIDPCPAYPGESSVEQIDNSRI